jgi:hypothetical protein
MFPLINYDVIANVDLNQLNPAGDSQPHDICRSQTYIYQPSLGSSKTKTGSRHLRAQYSTALPYSSRVGTRYSRHLSTPSVWLSFLIME